MEIVDHYMPLNTHKFRDSSHIFLILRREKNNVNEPIELTISLNYIQMQ